MQSISRRGFVLSAATAAAAFGLDGMPGAGTIEKDSDGYALVPVTPA